MGDINLDIYVIGLDELSKLYSYMIRSTGLVFNVNFSPNQQIAEIKIWSPSQFIINDRQQIINSLLPMRKQNF